MDTEVGRFVCAGGVAHPVHYPLLRGRLRADGDCALWAPYVDGVEAPWGGRGLLTANAYLLVT